MANSKNKLVTFKVILPKMFDISENDFRKELLVTETKMNSSSLMRFHLDESSIKNVKSLPKSKSKKQVKESDPKALKLLKEVIDGRQLNPFDDTLKAKICRFLYKTTKNKKYDQFG